MKFVPWSLVGLALSVQMAFAQTATEGTCKVNGEIVDCAEMFDNPVVKMLFSGGIILLILVIVFGIFWLMMLIDAISRPSTNKVIWILMMIMFGPIVSIIYYIAEVSPRKKLVMQQTAPQPQGTNNPPPTTNFK